MDDQNFHPSLKPVTQYVPLMGMSAGGVRFFDNSTIDTFRVCPRKAYFRHVRKFEPTMIRIPLIFGSSWHSGMDFIWPNAKTLNKSQLEEGARHAFMSKWNESGISEELSFDYYPRTPGRAFEMIPAYITRYHAFLQSIEVLEVEQPFIVPLQFEDEFLYYIGKLDKVYEEMRRIYICDHKTASSFKEQWLSSFSPNGQMDGYLHAGFMSYGDKFSGVSIDGALVQKTQIDFTKVPLQRQIQQLEAWNWEVMDYIDLIELNEKRLIDYRESGKQLSFMPAFPKCTSSCTTYYGVCPYIDLCKFWNNPEDHACPENFVEKAWEPFQIASKADGTFDIVIKEGE